MKKMPYEIKQKLRQYANLQIKVAQMAKEIDEMIEEYGVPIENLIAMGNIYIVTSLKQKLLRFCIIASVII